MWVFALDIVRHSIEMKSLIFATLCNTFLLCGCIAKYPTDITVNLVKAVNNREQAELPAKPIPGTRKAVDPYRDFLFAMSEDKGELPITPGDVAVYFREQQGNETFKNLKIQKPLLKVEFTSRVSLSGFIRDKGYTLFVSPYFCDRPNDVINWGLPYVYWQGLNISYPLNYAIEQIQGEPITYYVYINVLDDFNGPSSYERFDLRTNPEDICFKLKGGGMGFGFESNAVVIHKGEIVKALNDLTPTLSDIKKAK